MKYMHYILYTYILSKALKILHRIVNVVTLKQHEKYSENITEYKHKV